MRGPVAELLPRGQVPPLDGVRQGEDLAHEGGRQPQEGRPVPLAGEGSQAGDGGRAAVSGYFSPDRNYGKQKKLGSQQSLSRKKIAQFFSTVEFQRLFHK